MLVCGRWGAGMRICLLLLLLVMTAAAGAEDGVSPQISRTMQLVKQWVRGGYDNRAQAQADVDAEIADELKHREMHQLFAPAEIPALEGFLVYQQASVDGSTEPDRIWRNGVLQFLPDPASASVRMRELRFRDPARFYNAQFDRDKLAELSLEDFEWDAGCDFFLRTEAGGARVAGPIAENSCRLEAPGTGEQLVADDEVVVTPDEFWFLGRYVNAAGRVMWGNASPEHVKLRRRSELSTILRPDGGVLIFGATRNTGLELARLLVARGEPVTAFVRASSDRSEIEALGVRLVTGDALDPDAVATALSSANFSAVVSTLGCYGCEAPPDYAGNRNVFDAAAAAGVDRVILVSTLGAGDSADTPPFPVRWFLGDVMALKTQAEDHLIGLQLDHTIIRPGALKDAPATGHGLLTEDVDALGVITRADLARLILDCLDDQGSIGRVYSAKDSEMSWPWGMFF